MLDPYEIFRQNFFFHHVISDLSSVLVTTGLFPLFLMDRISAGQQDNCDFVRVRLSVPSPHPCAPHAQPITFFLILSPAQYWVRSTNHLAPCYAVSSSLPLPRPT